MAHGLVDVSCNLNHAAAAGAFGNVEPNKIAAGKNPMHLDSAEPSIPYRDFVSTETRFSMLWQSNPEAAEAFLKQAQQDVKNRYHYYKQLSELEWNQTTSVSAIKAQVKTALAQEIHHD